MAPPPTAITVCCLWQASLIVSRSSSRNLPSPSSPKISAIGLPVCLTISSSVSRKSQFNLRATSSATRDLPVPEKPVITRLVICLSAFIDYACQYIEKPGLEQELVLVPMISDTSETNSLFSEHEWLVPRLKTC